MGKYFMDLNNGDIGFAFDENSGVTSTGQPVMRVGDNMITNLMTGCRTDTRIIRLRQG